MQCAEYDTYVTRKDRRIMNFNVIVGKSTPRYQIWETPKQCRSRRTKNKTGRLSILPYTRGP